MPYLCPISDDVGGQGPQGVTIQRSPPRGIVCVALQPSGPKRLSHWHAHRHTQGGTTTVPARPLAAVGVHTDAAPSWLPPNPELRWTLGGATSLHTDPAGSWGPLLQVVAELGPWGGGGLGLGARGDRVAGAAGWDGCKREAGTEATSERAPGRAGGRERVIKGGQQGSKWVWGLAVHKHVCVCGSHWWAEVRGVRKRWGQMQDLNPRGAGGPRL